MATALVALSESFTGMTNSRLEEIQGEIEAGHLGMECCHWGKAEIERFLWDSDTEELTQEAYESIGKAIEIVNQEAVKRDEEVIDYPSCKEECTKDVLRLILNKTQTTIAHLQNRSSMCVTRLNTISQLLTIVQESLKATMKERCQWGKKAVDLAGRG